MSDQRKPRPKREAGAEDERRRRLDKVFGDVLPEGTRDERADSWGEGDSSVDDEWYRNQVPPHHG